MSSLLIKNAKLVVTMDESRREIPNCDVLIRDGVIAEVGPNLDLESPGEILDASGCLVIPGLVNTHNHVFGTLFRGAPHLHRVLPSDWVQGLYELVAARPLTADAFKAAALAHFGKSLLTGCTFTADHHWLYQRGGPRDFVDREVEAAREIGIRVHVSRGCMTRKGLVPEELVEDEADVLEHAAELIERYHDPSPYSMLRVFLSPTGLHSDTRTTYEEMCVLASRHSGIQLHTHFYPGYQPRADLIKDVTDDHLTFLEEVGWIGDNVVLYHFTTSNPDDIDRVTEHGSWVSLCTAMDMRMSFAGSGGTLPPLRELLDASGRVALGSSNQAMNEGTILLHDMRACWLADRLRFDNPQQWPTVRDILWMATRGGSLALGREDLGSVEPGKGADLAIFDLEGIEMACHLDPIPALFGFTGYTKATIVNGQIVVRDGRLTTVDQNEIARKAHEHASKFIPVTATRDSSDLWSIPTRR